MFQDLATAIPPSQRRRAEKCTVRECDETEKDTFIAYVDEGTDTYDVSLTFSNKGLTASSCDCKQKTALCQHKAALLLFLAAPPAKKKAAAKVKKTDPVISLLNDIETSRLKEWLGGLLLNNKDIRLAFELEFAPSGSMSIEDIIEKTKSAVKTVVKNKKNVDVNQLKKIIDLWLKIHEPILQEYYGAVYSKDAFLRYHAALKTSSLEFERIITLSNKILVYIGERISAALEPIRNLVHEEQWQAAINLIFDGMHNATHFIKMCYIELLMNLMEVSSEERSDTLFRQLMARYKSILAIHPAYEPEVGTLFLKSVNQRKAFDAFGTYFSVIDYAASYNYMLIESLVAVQKYAEAEKICLNEIKFHAKNNERVVYYQWLVKIYELTGDAKKKHASLQRVFPYTYRYADYRYVYDHLGSEAERVAWRSSALKTIQYPSKQMERPAFDFRLSLAIDEDDARSAMHIVENGAPYSIIDAHKEQLDDRFGDAFLQSLMERYDESFELLTPKQFDQEVNAVGSIVNFVLHNYGTSKVARVLQAVKKTKKRLYAELARTLEGLLDLDTTP